MKLILCAPFLLLMTSCDNHRNHSFGDAPALLVQRPSPAKLWIENHLTPLHSLVADQRRKSIVQTMLEDSIPGVSIALVDQGQIAWTASYGYSDLAKSELVTSNTVFAGASLSKPLTAIAALKLVESGVLTLDSDVNQYLRDWKIPENEFTEKEKVTLRHLLGHRAGVKNDLWSSYLPEDTVPSLTQLLGGNPPSVDPSVSLVATPGAEQFYSNPGYSIIQKIIEDVTHKSFEAALHSLVTQPSKMKDSSFMQPIPEYLQARKAIGYDETLTPYPYRVFPYKAAGGVWTTPSDMARFVIALFHDLDGQQTILTTEMSLNVFSRTRERLAFAKVFDEKSSDLIFRHYGSNQGFTAYMLGSITKRQAVVIMTNSDNGFDLIDYIARAFAEYYQWDYLTPITHSPIPVSEELMRKCEGHFEIDNEKLNFAVSRGALWLTSTEHAKPLELVPVAETEFISPSNSVKFEFYPRRDGQTEEIRWVRIIKSSGRDRFAEKK